MQFKIILAHQSHAVIQGQWTLSRNNIPFYLSLKMLFYCFIAKVFRYLFIIYFHNVIHYLFLRISYIKSIRIPINDFCQKVLTGSIRHLHYLYVVKLKEYKIHNCVRNNRIILMRKWSVTYFWHQISSKDLDINPLNIRPLWMWNKSKSLIMASKVKRKNLEVFTIFQDWVEIFNHHVLSFCIFAEVENLKVIPFLVYSLIDFTFSSCVWNFLLKKEWLTRSRFIKEVYFNFICSTYQMLLLSSLVSWYDMIN